MTLYTRHGPIPFVDHDTWRTAITAYGETARFAGRPKPGFDIPLRPDGITAYTSERVDAFDTQARRSFWNPSLPSFPSKPMTSPKRKYTLQFDGASKPVTLIAEGYVENGVPGEFGFRADDKLVAFHRFVKSVTAEDIEPTVEELKAELASLRSAAEARELDKLSDRMDGASRWLHALRSIRDQAESASFGNLALKLRAIQRLAADATE